MSEGNTGWFGFERLDVWQKAVTFARTVYRLTKACTREELFGLTEQPRRASVSVPANIAEGVSRSSRKDQVRFFKIAYGSFNEIVTIFHVASAEGLVEEEQLAHARSEISDMCRMLSGIKRRAMGEAR